MLQLDLDNLSALWTKKRCSAWGLRSGREGEATYGVVNVGADNEAVPTALDAVSDRDDVTGLDDTCKPSFSLRTTTTSNNSR